MMTYEDKIDWAIEMMIMFQDDIKKYNTKISSVMAGPDISDPVIYCLLEELYVNRSKAVHGAAFFKRWLDKLTA